MSYICCVVEVGDGGGANPVEWIWMIKWDGGGQSGMTMMAGSENLCPAAHGRDDGGEGGN